jgi:hypothetical protein
VKRPFPTNNGFLIAETGILSLLLLIVLRKYGIEAVIPLCVFPLGVFFISWVGGFYGMGMVSRVVLGMDLLVVIMMSVSVMGREAHPAVFFLGSLFIFSYLLLRAICAMGIAFGAWSHLSDIEITSSMKTRLFTGSAIFVSALIFLCVYICMNIDWITRDE